MKILLLTLVSILLFSTTQSQHSTFELSKYKPLLDKCIQETGFDPNAVAIKSIDEQANNKEFKCFLKCLMVETDTMDGTTGVLDLEKGRKIGSEVTGLDPVRWENVLNVCKAQNDDDTCEKAYKLLKCVSEEIKKIFS